MKNAFLVISALIIVAIVAVWGSALCYFSNIFPLNTEPNKLGDSINIVTALFSGLALAGVVITLFLQMQELSLQREELHKSVKAQEESARALSSQLSAQHLATKISAKSALLNSLNQYLQIIEDRINTARLQHRMAQDDTYSLRTKISSLEDDIQTLIKQI